MNAKNNNKNGMNVIENKETGWQVNEVLPFAEYHNFFIKGKIVISRLGDMVCEKLRIDREDASTWAKDIRLIVWDEIYHYDDKRQQYESDEEHDRAISEQILGDAIIMREEAYECAQMVMDHTPEEKQEFLEYCWKYVSQATNRINRMTKIFKPSDVEQ